MVWYDGKTNLSSMWKQVSGWGTVSSIVNARACLCRTIHMWSGLSGSWQPLLLKDQQAAQKQQMLLLRWDTHPRYTLLTPLLLL
jgi:hypothetical protein